MEITLLRRVLAAKATVFVGLALVTMLGLAITTAPANAEPVSRLQLISIFCDETEDLTGPDEPYIRVNGNVVWQGVLNDKDSANLQGVPEIPFSGSTKMSLWDDDAGFFDDDDFLGEVEITHTDGTQKTAVFDRDGARYEITYVVHQDNTPPAISAMKPTPGSRVRDRTPLIAATVRDAESDLSKSNLRLFVDGSARDFSYDANTDRLTYASTKLNVGRHTVRIEARDPQGLEATKVWSFKVVKRR